MRLVMANNYTSVRVVADKILRHPMMAGISFESIIDYTVDFIRIVQCQGFFEEKCDIIEIENHKGLLPNDFYEVNQIRLHEYKYKIPKYEEVVINGEGVITTQYVQTGYEDAIITSTNNIFKYASDTFHMSENKEVFDLTYKIQGGYIFTSIKEGTIEISYQAIILDDEGYPVIPDNSKFLRALEAYIKKQWFTILFDMSKLQAPILQNIQQEYAWAVGACESEFQKLSLDKAESFYNSWRTLLPRTREHSRRFTTTNLRENLKIN